MKGRAVATPTRHEGLRDVCTTVERPQQSDCMQAPEVVQRQVSESQYDDRSATVRVGPSSEAACAPAPQMMQDLTEASKKLRKMQPVERLWTFSPVQPSVVDETDQPQKHVSARSGAMGARMSQA